MNVRSSAKRWFWSAVAAALIATLVAVSLLGRPVEEHVIARTAEPETSAGSGSSGLADPGSLASEEVRERVPTASSPAGRERDVVTKAQLTVRTLDAGSGAPLAGVHVRVVPPGPHAGRHPARRFARGITDANATWTHAVSAGTDLRVVAEGTEPRIGTGSVNVDPLAPGEARTIELRVPIEDLVFCGRVVDRERGLPIGNAQVGLATSGSRLAADSFVLRVATDGDGRFEIRASRRCAEWPILVQADGYGAAPGVLRVGHDAPEQAQLFTLAAGATLTGRVTDERGAPIPRRSLTVVADASGCFEGPARTSFECEHLPRWTMRTDDAGRYRVSGLPAHARLCVEVGDARVDRAALALREPILEPGEERTLDLVVPAPLIVHGVVRDEDGDVVPNLEVQVQDARTAGWMSFDTPVATAQADENGRFVLPEVLPGVWRIGPSRASEVVPYGEAVELRSGAGVQEIEVRVRSGGFLAGRVEDASGAPVRRATVRVRGTSWGYDAVDDTLADGRFELGPLLPGDYVIEASLSGLIRSEPVRARPSDELVVVRLPTPPAGAIRGRLTGAWSEETRVLAFRRGERGFAESGPNRRGTFVLDGLPDGTYDLVAFDDSGAWGRARAVAPSTARAPTFELALTPAATVRVTVRDDTPWSVARALQDGSVVACTLVGRGTTRVLVVPEGPLTIEIAPAADEDDSAQEPRWTRDVVASRAREPELEFP